jgi:hypothetical protein
MYLFILVVDSVWNLKQVCEIKQNLDVDVDKNVLVEQC